MVVWVREFADTGGGLAGLPSRFSSSSMASVAFRMPAVLPLLSAPTHPQILTCYEEATHFTGTLPPIGPHDIGFGPGYFPQARRLATMSPRAFVPRPNGPTNSLRWSIQGPR